MHPRAIALVLTLALTGVTVPARVEIEQRGGRYEADVIGVPGYETDLMKRSGLLQPYRAPESVDYLPGYSDPDGYWTANVVLTDAIMYNTEKLRAAGLRPPTAWADFARPEWRGKFAIFTGAVAWYAALKRTMGPAALATTHQLMSTLTVSGEYVAGVGVYGHEAYRDEAQGLPVKVVSAPPTVAELAVLTIAKNAPHLNAARLFIRWSLSRQGQLWMLANLNRVSARKDVQNNPAIWNPRMRIVASNPSDSLTYNDDLRTFNSIFGIH